MNAEGNSGGRWTRRLSVLVLLITTGGLGAGLALFVAPGAGSASVWPERDNQGSSPAHVLPVGGDQGLYTHDSNTCDVGSRKDPINVIFVGPFGDYGSVNAHASDSSHGGWSNHSGEEHYFLDHGQCELMDESNASAGLADRWHMRYNQGPDVDPVWEQYTVASAHREDFKTTCPITPGHAVEGNDDEPPGGFNKGRAEIWWKWTQEATDPHVTVWQENWDNTQMFEQCDGGVAWSNGVVFYIEIACTGVDPTVGLCDPDTTRVSESSSGEEGNGNSYLAAINSDGRFVAFDSEASNLVAGDTNGSRDVFVHDRATGVTERVSVDGNGGEGNGMSFQASISSDGRFVAFESFASNLVQPDTNNARDIFVHDRLTGTTERVSVKSGGGPGNGGGEGAAISADGRIVAFVSSSTNLVPGDSNGNWDIFVHDRETGITGRVSVDSGGGQANGSSWSTAISSDGRFVAFESWASNLVPGAQFGVFVHDRQTGGTELVSVDNFGSPANDLSNSPSISGDGRYVAFWTFASNLVIGDFNNRDDVFVHDRETHLTERVSEDSAGKEANSNSFFPAISGDGRFVIFDSFASNLVVNDTNGVTDAFLHDRVTGTTQRVSVSSSGGEVTGDVGYPAVNEDGTVVAFHSTAPDLIAIDTNGVADVFVRSSTTDTDGDGLPDSIDLDDDNDSLGIGDPFGLFFRDEVEAFMARTEDPDGTDPLDRCADTSTTDDEDDDKWGPDFDDSQDVDGSDLFLFAERFGSELGVPPPSGKQPYIVRFDIYPTAASLHKIDGSDLFVLAKYFGLSCA